MESLSAVPVTEVPASVALCARVKNMQNAITRPNFTRSNTHSWRHRAGPRLRPVIGLYTFCVSLQNFAQSTKSKETYTTVRFSFRKDTLLAAPDMRPVIGFYILCASSQNLCQVTENKETYTTVRLSHAAEPAADWLMRRRPTQVLGITCCRAFVFQCGL